MSDGATTDAADPGDAGRLVDGVPADSPDAGGDATGPATDAPDLPDSGTPLTGRVLDRENHRPLAGRAVVVRQRRAVTDANGQFTIASVEAQYDLTVVDPDGSTVSIYRGLTRRDPVLVHRPSANADAPKRMSRVSGALSGAGAYPLTDKDGVEVVFFSPEADRLVVLGSGLGPSYGPLILGWDGPTSTTGQLVALRLSYTTNGVQYAGYAAQPLTLADGVPAMIDLTFSPPTEGRIAGTVQSPAGYPVDYKQAFYRTSIPHGIVDLPTDESTASTFDYPIPELGNLDASLCVAAGSALHVMSTERCGLMIGATDVHLTMQAPPLLSAPKPAAVLESGADFAWGRFENGVHALALTAKQPSKSAPSVDVYTSATSEKWPDLTPAGIAFPKSAAYSISVEGLGPFATIDEACGADGLGAIRPAETRRSASDPIDVSTAP
jgi:hypothetical protein